MIDPKILRVNELIVAPAPNGPQFELDPMIRLAGPHPHDVVVVANQLAVHPPRRLAVADTWSVGADHHFEAMPSPTRERCRWCDVAGQILARTTVRAPVDGNTRTQWGVPRADETKHAMWMVGDEGLHDLVGLGVMAPPIGRDLQPDADVHLISSSRRWNPGSNR